MKRKSQSKKNGSELEGILKKRPKIGGNPRR